MFASVHSENIRLYVRWRTERTGGNGDNYRDEQRLLGVFFQLRGPPELRCGITLKFQVARITSEHLTQNTKG
jgi:hypothetical protein